MDRAARIKFCEICTNKGFSPQSGIICKLTDASADFETTCPDFNEDKIESGKLAEYRASREKEEDKKKPFRMEKRILNSGILGGILTMVGALAWLIIGLTFDNIFYYPIALFIIGVITLIRGILKQKEVRKKQNMDVLDDEI